MSLRWGICGAGKISHDFVVGVSTRSESEHQVVAVASRSLESAAKFAGVHGIQRYYGSYEDLANDKEVSIYICKDVPMIITPPTLQHRPLVLRDECNAIYTHPRDKCLSLITQR